MWFSDFIKKGVVALAQVDFELADFLTVGCHTKQSKLFEFFGLTSEVARKKPEDKWRLVLIETWLLLELFQVLTEDICSTTVYTSLMTIHYRLLFISDLALCSTHGVEASLMHCRLVGNRGVLRKE